MQTFNFLVERNQLGNYKIEQSEVPTPADGETLIRVDRFALTANNITYGVAGDLIGYWQFFPAEDGMGRIPVWGIGTVIKSNSDGVTEGQRYYGYFPMSGHLIVAPTHITERGFVDNSEHRQALPPTYNQYALMTEANGFPAAEDNYQMLYKPLFATAFVIDDFLDDNGLFEANQVILSSASSKTSFGTAFLLKQRGVKCVGLTSAGNKDFVISLGLYDEVVTYDEVESLDASIATVFVDMAGNRSVLSKIHHHFKDQLKYSCGVGITHYDARDGEDPQTLPGATPAMFFAPTQMQKRIKEWGGEAYQNKLADAWKQMIANVDQWVTITEYPGRDAIGDVYKTMLNGAPPNKGYIITL